MVFILALSLYYTYSGTIEYQRFSERKESIIKFEKEKWKYYTNYSQYGGYGFRVLLTPSPLSVFFINSSIFKDVECNVDQSERLNIYHSVKGKNLFSFMGNFRDFSSVIFLFGSLFMLYMGTRLIKSKESLKFQVKMMGFKKKFLASFFFRLIILDLLFVLLSGLIFLVACRRGVPLSMETSSNFFIYFSYCLLYLNFFYVAGLFFSVISRFKITVYIWIFIFWIASTFLIPEVKRIFLLEDSQALPATGQMNIAKLKTLMQFEAEVQRLIKGVKDYNETIATMQGLAKKYATRGLKLNEEREKNLNEKMEQLIFRHENLAILYPSLYYTCLSNEISSLGYNGYLKFLRHILELKNKFSHFIFDNRHLYGQENMKPFIKNYENIFKPGSTMPRTMWYGFLTTLLYSILVFFLAYIYLKRIIYHDSN